QGVLCKINTRPVYFLHKQAFSQQFFTLSRNEYASVAELLAHGGKSWSAKRWRCCKPVINNSAFLPSPGFNLIIHEVAHKLDMRNGDRASGIPFIPLRDVAGWEHDLHAA
ncbi:zinc-dependent peptidase, partial [Salmonella enterica subsp. enterica serovar Montevideo]|nr:zinc-dependent peptidase [Salmonella enterica subsp. enterica serovar Montevideo]